MNTRIVYLTVEGCCTRLGLHLRVGPSVTRQVVVKRAEERDGVLCGVQARQTDRHGSGRWGPFRQPHWQKFLFLTRLPNNDARSIAAVPATPVRRGH